MVCDLGELGVVLWFGFGFIYKVVILVLIYFIWIGIGWFEVDDF
jgi:hypothetical protein